MRRADGSGVSSWATLGARWRIVATVSFWALLGASTGSWAACVGNTPLNPVTDVCWSCMLPIRVAGADVEAQVIPGMPPNPPGLDSSPVCGCPTSPPVYWRWGIPVSFFEPKRIIEVVTDKYCFPSLGINMAGDYDFLMDGAQEGSGVETGGVLTTRNIHVFSAPLLNILGMFKDLACLSGGSTIVPLFLSEAYAPWHSDQLAAVVYPETVLFSNPAIQIAGMADAVAANMYLGIPTMPWIAGSRGVVYPLTGSAPMEPALKGSIAALEKGIFMLPRLGACSNGVNLCGCVHVPVINKWDYRYHIAKPVPDVLCHNYGRSSRFWATGMLSNLALHNQAYVVFEKGSCCAF